MIDGLKTFRDAVAGYWFGPGSYRDLALIRIVVVSGHLLFFYPSLERQLEYAAQHPDLFLALPALKVLLLPLGEWGLRPEPTLIHAVWLVGIVAGISAVLGKYTRLSLLVHAVAATFLVAHIYSYGMVHHGRAVLVIALWALALSRCNRVWSLDSLQTRMTQALAVGRFRARAPEEEHGEMARWPLLTVQWILALAYLSAGMSKLVNGGLDWFRPSTLAHILVQDGLRHDTPLGLALASFTEILPVIAVTVVLFELTFFLAVVIPRTAWAYVAMGVAMHVGIILTQGAPFLQWAMLYLVFLPSLRSTFPATYLKPRLARVFRSREGAGRRAVIYDGYCSLCIRTMVILDELDTGGRLEAVDLERQWDRMSDLAPSLSRDEARHHMGVVAPDGRVLQGFQAFRELSRALPTLWLLFPITHAPFAGTIGPRVYRAIARRRTRTGPCGTAGCAVGLDVST